MPQTTEPAFTDAANVTQLGQWLGISRNRVGAFVAELGVLPAGRKYPDLRLISGVLGLDVPSTDIEPLTHKLMTLAEAAVILGYSAQDLKTKAEVGEISVPPMYVFGERSRRFIRHQFLAFSRNPRGCYERYAFLPGFLMSIDEIAHEAELKPNELVEKPEAGSLAEPSHVILEGGKKLYFRAHVKTILKPFRKPEEHGTSPEMPAFSGGILGQVARTASSANQS
jgi:hypothetical protein